MAISSQHDLLKALLSSCTERQVADILYEIGDRSELTLDEDFGPLHLSWHAFGDKESNLSSIGIGSKPGRSLTERLTNAIDAILELRKPIGVEEPHSSREAAQQWFGRPMSGPGTGLYQWKTPSELDRQYAVLLLECGKPEHATIDVIDHGIGLKPEEFQNTILSLQYGNKIKKRYLIGAFGQGGASTLAFAPYTLIVSRSAANPSVIAFTLIRVLVSGEGYKEDIYAYLSIKKGDESLSVPSALVSDPPKLWSVDVKLPSFDHGTVIRHFNYQLPRLAAPLQASPGNLYHYLHSSFFDPLLPLRIIDLRQSDVKDELVSGSRTRLMRLKPREKEIETGSELRHYRQMEYVVPAGSDSPCIGIEYWVVYNYRKSKGGLILRPASNELFIQPGKPIVGTLNGQNQGERTAALCHEVGLKLTSKHIIIHVDCTLALSTIRRNLFATSREEFKDGEVLTSVMQELKRMLAEDEELAKIEKELTERITKREVSSANDEVKRTVTQLLKEAGFKEREQGPSFEPSTTGEERKTKRERQPGYRVREPLSTLPYPQVTYFKIVSPPLKLDIHKNDTQIVLAETDADAEYFRQERIAIRTEPDHLRVVSVSPLRGGRIRWRLQPSESATVGDKGRVIASLTKPNGEQIVDDSLPFEVLEEITKPAKKSKNVVPPFDIIPIDPQNNPEQWAVVWPSLSDETDITKLSSVAYKAMDVSGTVIVYYSTIFAPLAQFIEKLKAETAKAAIFEQNYKVWIAYHAILQMQSSDDVSHIVVHEDSNFEIRDMVEALHEKECSRTGEMIVRQAKQLADLTLKAVGQESIAIGASLE